MKNLYRLLLLSVTVFAFSINALALEGSGTAADPYLISTPEDFNDLRTADFDKHFKITEDLDMYGFDASTEAKTFYPIINENATQPFSGSIDGDGHVIMNLTVTPQSDAIIASNALHQNVGVFGAYGFGGADRTGALTKLGFENLTINAKSSTAKLVGLIGKTLNCGVDISECYITNSTISGGTESVAGFVAGVSSGQSPTTITNCFVDATIESIKKGGGFVGEDFRPDTHLKNCAFYGHVITGSLRSGPIAAVVNKETSVYENCFYLDNGDTYSWQRVEHVGAPIVPADIKTESSYVGFDFDNVWTIGDDYAQLRFGNEPSALFSAKSNINFEVYPNPCQGVCNIKLQNPAEISVRNLAGQLFLQTNAAAGNQRLDLSSFNSGMYLLTVSDANDRLTVKLQLNK